MTKGGTLAMIWLGVLPSVAHGQASPVAASFAYTGEAVATVAGGAHRGTAYVGLAAAEASLQLGPLLGWRGAQLFVLGEHSHGGNPSADAQDLQGISNLAAARGVRLEEVWLQQNLLGNRVSLLAGRYDLNSEFYRLQSAAVFVNSSFGIGPEFSSSGQAGPSIFPNPAIGTRLGFKPSPNMVMRVAVMDGAPVSRPGGFRFFAADDGILLVSEVALLARADSTGEPPEHHYRIGRGINHSYSGKIALGGWYYTARFPDLSATVAGGSAQQHRGSGGVYLIADQTLWTRRDQRPGALAAFVQLGLGDKRVNQIGGYIGGGVTFTAPFPRRDADVVGLAVAAARNGSHFREAQGDGTQVPGGETAVEFTYLAQVDSWLAVQPNLQYVIHPGGVGTSGAATVVGLRVSITH